jgi:intracellular septation protein
MRFLFDFFPIIAFFLCYKFFGIYIATVAAVGIAIAQIAICKIKGIKLDRLQLLSMVMIVILGGATIIFHNDWFIKWKPTAIYWASAIALLFSQFSKKTFVEDIMGANVTLPTAAWSKLNLAWIAYFFLMGIVNIYVAYFYSTDFWVNFKLFGSTGCLVVFVLLQGLYLGKHAK